MATVRRPFRSCIVAMVTVMALFISGCSVGKEYRDLLAGFWAKIDHLARVDQENQELRARVAVLEAEHFHRQGRAAVRAELHRASNLKTKSETEGGEKIARTEESLVPEIYSKNEVADEEKDDVSIMSVPPRKIYEQATKSFEKGEFDRAARGFLALANNRENGLYATAQVNYMAGTSLFELKNYRRALKYFGEAYAKARAVRQPASGSEDVMYAPRSLSWMALCHKKLGDQAKAQSVVQELINNYPHSPEARRFR